MSDTFPAPIALIGLKTYLTHARTLAWFDGLCALVREGRAEGLTVIVLPPATALAVLAEEAAASGVILGAQDCSWAPAGACTGELPATLLAEVGARVVEIGHAERRHAFGDTEEVVAAKVRAAVAAGLAPMLCVGEQERSSPDAAAAEVIGQLASALTDVATEAPMIVAYEPVWAIGADRPAPAEHIVGVVHAIRGWLTEHRRGADVIYGGTAGPGLYREVATAVDGLGLGRRVHDLAALGGVLDEMRPTDRTRERGAAR